MNGLTDMARTDEDKDASPLVVSECKYPYGLQISLDQGSLEKLGVDLNDFEIGDIYPLDILVKVVGKNANESEGGEARACVSLQITHIGAEEELAGEEEVEDDEPSLERHGYLRYGK